MGPIYHIQLLFYILFVIMVIRPIDHMNIVSDTLILCHIGPMSNWFYVPHATIVLCSMGRMKCGPMSIRSCVTLILCPIARVSRFFFPVPLDPLSHCFNVSQIGSSSH